MQKTHKLCLIIHNYACKRHHLAYSAAHYHNKSSYKISAWLIKDSQRNGEKQDKVYNGPRVVESISAIGK